MKINRFNTTFLLLIAILFFACNNTKEVKFAVTNNANIDITDAQIVIPVSDILELWETKKENQTIALKNAQGGWIPFQLDSLDENIKEIAFVLDLKANEKTQVSMTLVSNDELPEFQKYTNIRLGKDVDFDGSFENIKEEMRDTSHKPQAFPVLYQMEGVAWENDKVGFRSYWDSRNGKDIFGKLIETPVLDTVGLPGKKTYHELGDWGMDILKVGNSLGSGAVALSVKDSLYRLGETKSAYFKQLTEGPIRAIFDLGYKGWMVNGKEYELVERITLWKGKYFYSSKLFLTGELDSVELVTGITNLHTDTFYTSENNNYNILYTHDLQSENKDSLGMAVLVENSSFKGHGITANEGNGITNTYFTKMEVAGEPEYFFVAGWEKTNKDFSSKSGFEKYLDQVTKEISNPVSIKKVAN
ncbi:MAG: DUF4861 domain-containing protein [Bacteroidota bacterium]